MNGSADDGQVAADGELPFVLVQVRKQHHLTGRGMNSRLFSRYPMPMSHDAYLALRLRPRRDLRRRKLLLQLLLDARTVRLKIAREMMPYKL